MPHGTPARADRPISGPPKRSQMRQRPATRAAARASLPFPTISINNPHRPRDHSQPSGHTRPSNHSGAALIPPPQTPVNTPYSRKANPEGPVPSPTGNTAPNSDPLGAVIEGDGVLGFSEKQPTF